MVRLSSSLRKSAISGQHAAPIGIIEVRQRRARIILLQRVLPQLAPVLGKLFIRRLRFVIANQIVEYAPDAGHFLFQLRAERRPVGNVHSPRQASAVELILRQSLRLLIVDTLQQVFETT
ncbi:Uncharacterised protein [Raoultella terrigena]|uniref:Uncharacterized protein n=1 Tax=Raoultella terrigena TaxID=577 RepID=A0A4U9D6G8_RAOTE|nr:Uncharacterised protein [Raoultella terrigena]